jgi:predicted ATPase
MTGCGPIRTPDQRVRVFVSSTLGELASERAVVRAAIESLRLTPVMFELGARPHPPRELYRSYLDQSDIFIGLYWESYGWVAPDMTTSGIEDEFDNSSDKPRLLYVKAPAPGRDERLQALLDRMEAQGASCYRRFGSDEELGELVRDDLALALSERFYDDITVSLPAQSTRPGPRIAALPAPATTLIGREADLRSLCDLVNRPDVRLVTLSGPGGIGKTRLAIACADRMSALFSGGVSYVSLADTHDSDVVLSTVAAAIGAPVEHRRTPLEALIAQFREEPALLVLDNFEQVVAAGPRFVELLAACPLLKIMVTSRALLRLRGEHEYPVAPLGLLGDTDGDWMEKLGAVPSVQLFVDRARAACHDFEFRPDNALAIAEICRMLDGLPLAIEIAAARVRLLRPHALLARLTTRLDTLGAGPHDLPQRQRTLRAAIDWSYGLLDDESARVLAMLAVFADGWTTDAAAQVCQRDELEILEVLDVLAGSSLVVVAFTDDEPRFRMLGTIREYATELLAGCDDRRAIVGRHAAYYADFLRQAERPLRGEGQGEWAHQLTNEHGNIRAAVRWFIDAGDIETVSDLLWAGVLGWWLTGRVAEVEQWIRAAVDAVQEIGERSRAKLLTAAAVVALEVGDDQEVRSYLEESLVLLEDLDEPVIEAVALLFLGYVLPSFGALASAQQLIEHALDELRRLDEPFYTGLATTSLGGFLCLAGDFAGARRHQEEAIGLARRIGNERLLAQSSTELAVVAIAEGQRQEARSLLDQSSRMFLMAESTEGLALTLSAFARLALVEDDPLFAAQMLGVAHRLREDSGLAIWPSYREAEQLLIDSVTARLGGERFEAAWARGCAMSPAEAVDAAIMPR